jgi:type IV pilus assembly protein PilY1
VVSNVDYLAGNVAVTSIRPASVNACQQSPEASFFVLDPDSGMPNSDLLGTVTTTDVNGNTVTLPAAFIPIADQRVRIVDDGTKPATPHCPAGYVAKRVVGDLTDEIKCVPLTNTRIQWREIPGLRTR